MTSKITPDLFQPFQMGDLDLENRMVLAPLTRGRAGAERIPTAVMAEYYRQRSGAGLLISEATAVSEQGNCWVNAPGIYNEAQTRGWSSVTGAVHSGGSHMFLQLWHGGRASHSSFHGGELPVAPSAIAMEGEGVHTPHGKQAHETPRALETDEISGIVTTYVDAARRAHEAGFDGVEVHSANGYLLDQFLQSRTNHRQDRYGGSLENRFRLLREVLEGIAQVLPMNRVGVRLAPNGVFNDMGSSDYRETVTYAARELDGLGLAYLHVMDGLGFGFHELGEPVTLKELRAHFHGPLMGNCGYELKSAQLAIEGGSADLIAFGRPFIANPDLVARLRNDWPLAESDPETWFGGDPSGKDYSDYPVYSTSSRP